MSGPVSLRAARSFAVGDRQRLAAHRPAVRGNTAPATPSAPARRARTRRRAQRRDSRRRGASNSPPAHPARAGPARWRWSPAATPPRATTPSALPNGASVSNSPWATAANTGAGADVRTGHQSGQQLQTRPTSGSARGRPSWSSSTRSAAASDCSRASACSGARCHTPTRLPAPPSSAWATRSAPGEHRVRGRALRSSELRRRRRRAPTTPVPPAAPPRPRSPATRAGWPGAGAPGPAPRAPDRRPRRRRAAPSAGPAGQPSRGATLRQSSGTAARVSRPSKLPGVLVAGPVEHLLGGRMLHHPARRASPDTSSAICRITARSWLMNR